MMKTTIYYFSGTGNSLRAARVIAKELGGANLISVKADPLEFPAMDVDVIGFVCPVYEWDIPEVMKTFVEKLAVNPNAYIFMVATYIAIHGRCFESMEALLQKKGTHLNYAKALRCVASQCIAYEPFPSQKLMVPYSDMMATHIGKKLSQRKTNRIPKMSFITNKLYPKIIFPYINIQQEYAKGFYTTDACVGCEICKKICSCKNITFKNNRPVFHQQCISCNACVVYCPQHAIQYKKPDAYVQLNNLIAKKLCLPEKRTRYHNPYIAVKDMISNHELSVSVNSSTPIKNTPLLVYFY